MPVLLKSRNKNSPGIIAFTHGEALWGGSEIHKKKFLSEMTKNKKWIFEFIFKEM